jgi:hypothetical protein
MDTSALQHGYTLLLDAAAVVAENGGPELVPPQGEWNAVQILGHVALVDAGVLAAAAALASGDQPTYDNRTSLDLWTIERAIARCGGAAGLPDRIRRQGDALCALVGEALSEDELELMVSVQLLSGGRLVTDEPMSLRTIMFGLAQDHLPKHARQLLSLIPAPRTDPDRLPV